MTDVVVKESAYEHSRTYHVKEQLTERQLESGFDANVGPVGLTVKAMRGVANVYVFRYGIDVMKGEAFAWEEVEPQIIEFLRSLTHA